MPDAVGQYRRLVEHLETTLKTNVDKARELLQDVLGRVVVCNDEAGIAWGETGAFGTARLAGVVTVTDGTSILGRVVGRRSVYSNRLRLSRVLL